MKKALLVGILFGIASVLRADWQLVTPLSITNNLRAVANGNGKYIAGGDDILLYSLDNGANWKVASATSGLQVRAIAYGNGVYVAVGLGSQIFYSADAIHWQAADAPLTDFETINFGNGVFAATTQSGAIAYSTDGANWTSLGKLAPGGLWSAAFGNGVFVAISFNPSATDMTLLRSANGINWTTHTIAFPSTPIDYARPCPPQQLNCPYTYMVHGLAFGNGNFGAAVYYPTISGFNYQIKYLKSTDGLVWEWADSAGDDFVRQLEPLAMNVTHFANGSFFHFFPLSAPEIMVSSDLQAWAGVFMPVVPGGSIPGPDTVAGDGASIVAVGQKGYIAFGPAIDNLTVLTGGSLGKIWSVAAVGDRLVAVGPSGLIELSLDGGTTWKQEPLPTDAGDLESVAYGNGNFVGVGLAGTVVRSPFGDTWAKRLSNTTSDLHDIVFGNNLWVAVGNNGTIVTSPDASFFNLQNSQTQVRLNSVTFGNGQYVAVGADGAILNSSNATAWTARGADEAVTLNGVAYGNGAFVAVGNGGITHWSTDLVTWQTVYLPTTGNLSEVAFADGIFATIEEGTGRVFTSASAQDWVAETLEGAADFGVDSSDGRLLISGDRGVIWTYVQSPNIVLNGALDAQGKFKLTISAPVAGNYRVFSTTDATGTTWTPRDLVAVSSQATWTDPNPVGPSTFYFARKE